jgi:AhpD family alkylhydroperoxidase
MVATVADMTSSRIQVSNVLPSVHKRLIALHQEVERAAADAGLDQTLIELIKIRASQINGCAFCTDMHSQDALQHGESPRRLLLLPVWRETEFFTERERAALALTDSITTIASRQDVPDDVYEQAAKVFSDAELAVVVWAATVINAFNRLAVTSRKPLPAEG